MTVCTGDLEGGVHGNAVSTSDTGSLTAFDAAGGSTGDSVKYDNTHVAHGSLAAKMTTGSGGNLTLRWDLAHFGTLSDWYGRMYLYMTANPASAMTFFRPQKTTTQAFQLLIDTSGHIVVQDTSSATLATFTNAISLNQFVRVEVHANHTGSALEVKLFNSADSSTATETQTLNSVSMQSNATRLDFRTNITSTIYWIDQLVGGATAYPGPYPVSTVAPAVSGTASSGSTLTCDGGTWNGTFDLGYQWTSDGSNIVGATSSTYVSQAGDVGHAIGCKVTATGQQATNESATQASSNTITVTSSGATSGSASGGVNFPTAILIN